MNSLVEIKTSPVNGLCRQADEWEELEFLVDSGASASVFGENMVRAVEASDADPHSHYKLADGSIIPNQGKKLFTCYSDEGWGRRIGV